VPQHQTGKKTLSFAFVQSNPILSSISLQRNNTTAYAYLKMCLITKNVRSMTNFSIDTNVIWLKKLQHHAEQHIIFDFQVPVIQLLSQT
jgi:hypothetical protein